MLTPLAVDHAEQDVALQLTHRSLAGQPVDLGFPCLVSLFGVIKQSGLEICGAQLVGFPIRIGRDEFFGLDAHRVQRLERGPQRFEVPVLVITVGRGAVDVGGDGVRDHLLDLRLQILTLQDAATLGIDDLALLVHHLVVLEDVLADLEVLLLDLGLRTLDGAGHHLGFDRHIIGDVHARQNRFQRSAIEAPHQFITQREVEAGLARIALTSGTSAQLVVDTPRLVALGTQHVQAAGLLHLFGLGLGGVLELLQRRVPGVLVLVRGLHRVQALFAKMRIRQEVRVTTQHDVGAATGHVGGHRDGSTAPGLGDDAGFLLVVLGVEDVVRNPTLGELP